MGREMKVEGMLHKLLDDARVEFRVQFENLESGKGQRSSFKTGLDPSGSSHRFRVNLC
jgi:hypothetical protein